MASTSEKLELKVVSTCPIRPDGEWQLWNDGVENPADADACRVLRIVGIVIFKHIYRTHTISISIGIDA